MCPEFLNDTNNLTLTGNYLVGAGGLFIPSGATVQEFGTTESSLVWIEPSGQFAIFNAGSGWMMADVAVVPAGPASMEPNDPSVSGELRFWFEGGVGKGLELTTPGQSGAAVWNGAGPWGNNFNKSGTPYIASGDINGEDVAYCYPTSSNFADGTPKANSIQAFQGTNKPFCMMGVVKVQSNSTECIFSMANTGSTTTKQLMFGIHSSAGVFFLKRGDSAAVLKQIFGPPIGNIVIAEPTLLTFNSTPDGTGLRIYQNGVEQTTDVSGIVVGEACSPPGAAIGLFMRSSLDLDFNGSIGEIVVYSSGLEDTEREKIEQGLMTKFGIS